MFVGRQRELGELKQLYETGKFQCVIVYGQRRCGKTALISEFIKDKAVIYFMGQETNARENLENFSRSIFAYASDFLESAPMFHNYEDAFEAVFEMARDRRVILVIDEYNCLAASYKGISTLLQTCIDKHGENSNLFIMLCGSSLSFMENHVLGYKSPLYGRKTAQLKIRAFDYAQTKEYFSKSFNSADIALLYGITGGIPLYMSLIDTDLSVAENVKRCFLTKSGYMFAEPGNLIKQEFREPAQYNAIIRAVAGGASRLSDISGKTGIDTMICSTHLSKLISIGIIRKEYPFNEEIGKKTMYILTDSMFRFWYQFIPANVSLIGCGGHDIVLERIQARLPSFMGRVFEEMCSQYLWAQNNKKKTPFLFTDAGRWWGYNPDRREDFEIAIIAANKDDAIFGACKWTEGNMVLSDLEMLRNRSEMFQYKNIYYYLFAKTGFTGELTAQADKLGNVTLVGLDDM